MRGGRNNKYSYWELNTTNEFQSYSDIAIEFGVTIGSVAGKFRRSKDNTITIGNTKITRAIKTYLTWQNIVL